MTLPPLPTGDLWAPLADISPYPGTVAASAWPIRSLTGDKAFSVEEARDDAPGGDVGGE